MNKNVTKVGVMKIRGGGGESWHHEEVEVIKRMHVLYPGLSHLVH